MIPLPIVYPRKIKDAQDPIRLIQPPSLNNTNPNHIIFNVLTVIYQYYLRHEYFRLLFLPLLRLDANNKSLPNLEEKNILKFWLYDNKPVIKLSSIYQSHNKFGWYNCIKGEKTIIYLNADLIEKTESTLQNNPEQAQVFLFAIFSSYLHELANYFASNINGLYIYSPQQPEIFNANGYWLENILYRGKIVYQVFDNNKMEIIKVGIQLNVDNSTWCLDQKIIEKIITGSAIFPLIHFVSQRLYPVSGTLLLLPVSPKFDNGKCFCPWKN